MRIILLSTAAAILAGCASMTPPLCDRDQPWVKFGTTDDTCAAPVAFTRPDTSGDGFVMPSSPRPEPRPETPIIERPKPPHLDREDPPAKPVDPQPEPEKPEPPAEPEKPQPEKPDHPTKPEKPVKDKDNKGHGNGDEGDCSGKGCSDGDNPGKGKS